jgi:hypothetical protein
VHADVSGFLRLASPLLPPSPFSPFSQPSRSGSPYSLPRPGPHQRLPSANNLLHLALCPPSPPFLFSRFPNSRSGAMIPSARCHFLWHGWLGARTGFAVLMYVPLRLARVAVSPSPPPPGVVMHHHGDEKHFITPGKSPRGKSGRPHGKSRCE